MFVSVNLCELMQLFFCSSLLGRYVFRRLATSVSAAECTVSCFNEKLNGGLGSKFRNLRFEMGIGDA